MKLFPLDYGVFWWGFSVFKVVGGCLYNIPLILVVMIIGGLTRQPRVVSKGLAYYPSFLLIASCGNLSL